MKINDMMVIVLVVLSLCAVVIKVDAAKYANLTVEPGLRQLLDFKLSQRNTVGLWTTQAGAPIDIRNIITVNSDAFINQLHLDTNLNFDAERIPERSAHAKGTAAEGYFEVTHDIHKYTNADVFNGIGKKTPVLVRFSSSVQSTGGPDASRELKGMAVKFYTKHGNLDLLCLQSPVYLYTDPLYFNSGIKVFKRNPRTGLFDPTARWDLVTLRPSVLHLFMWTSSDYGLPNGYRRMNSFPIHVFELNNEKGERYYVKFNFRTEQGLANLTSAEAAQITGQDIDYFNRDLYNAIARNDFPSWRLEMDVMTLDNLRKVDYNPFDVTRLWKNGTYYTVPIGRLVLNKNPENMFRAAEQSAFMPGNLVPGIPGPVDFLYKGRRVFYRDTQNYRLGRNHNKIEVNQPKYAQTYVRDGVPPIGDNMGSVPNYFPNSFSGPAPYVDHTYPKEKLTILESNAIDLEPANFFYNSVLRNDAERQRLISNLVASLIPVTPPVQKRALWFLNLVDQDLGRRVTEAVEISLAANTTSSGKIQSENVSS